MTKSSRSCGPRGTYRGMQRCAAEDGRGFADRSDQEWRDLEAARRDVDRDWREGEHVPDLRDRTIVRDSEGSMRGGNRDHRAGDGVRSAFEDTLTAEDIRALAARRWRGRFF